VALIIAGGFLLGSDRRARPALDSLARFPVRRTDLSVTLTAGGRVQSANRTVIKCQLESLEVRVRGQGMSAGGASTILSLIPDGTRVRRGDVLCRLDASEYEELVRQQQMNVVRADADHQRARLDVEIAQMAVREFLEGTMPQVLKDYDGRIVLAQSDLERATDRLTWSRRMLEKGYVSRALVANDELGLRRVSVDVSRLRLAREMYRRFSAARTRLELECQVVAAGTTLSFQTRRLRRNQERLANLERQVQRCTIRAPHDGFVIYANEEYRDVRIEPGVSVRQNQDLFYLPDLTQMEVETLLHESVANQVRTGMLARVRVEGVSDRLVEGHVDSVAQVPMRDRRTEIRYFIAEVQLDNVPRGLRPGMTAEVEITTARRRDVLSIPAEALAVEDGRKVCYIAGRDRLERREVKVGSSTRDLLEVTEGLAEGEEVILDPDQLGGAAEEVVEDAPEVDAPEPGDPARVAALQRSERVEWERDPRDRMAAGFGSTR
jgi:HlyD family secretion protein